MDARCLTQTPSIAAWEDAASSGGNPFLFLLPPSLSFILPKPPTDSAWDKFRCALRSSLLTLFGDALRQAIYWRMAHRDWEKPALPDRGPSVSEQAQVEEL
jgi:hypothetical protein